MNIDLVLVLGHNGLLGRMVTKVLEKDFLVATTDHRYPSNDFTEFVKDIGAKYIINCIGKVPQKQPTHQEFIDINVGLPLFLASNFPESTIINPGTDCMYSGKSFTKKVGETPFDPPDMYGMSKMLAFNGLVKYPNTFQIVGSIIGPDVGDKSLLGWIEHTQESTIDGYLNHYWNGVTTLEWAMTCAEFIKKPIEYRKTWGSYMTISGQLVSKYDIVSTWKDVLEKDIAVNAIMTEQPVHRILEGDSFVSTRPLKSRLEDARKYYINEDPNIINFYY